MAFPANIIPSIVGAGASFVGGLINNEYAQSRADQQWYRTLEMQDKMNAYNAPISQVARLKEAGLNPNLVYANGGAVIQSAGGQPPAPPQSHPIDTQGVLQMVQTIVGAMLEKDKIQANKEMQSQQIQSNQDIAEARNTTDKQISEARNKSSERNVDVTTASNQSIATERNKTEKEMQKERIESNEKIEFAKLSESARQADMRNAIDRGHLVIDQFMASLAKQRTDADVEESRSRKFLNEQQYRLHESLDQLTIAVESGKIREQQIRNGITEIENFLSRPGYIDTKQLGALYDKYGIAYNQSQLDEIKSVFDKLHHRMGIDATISDNYVTPFIGELSDAILKPLSALK